MGHPSLPQLSTPSDSSSQPLPETPKQVLDTSVKPLEEWKPWTLLMPNSMTLPEPMVLLLVLLPGTPVPMINGPEPIGMNGFTTPFLISNSMERQLPSSDVVTKPDMLTTIVMLLENYTIFSPPRVARYTVRPVPMDTSIPNPRPFVT